MIYFAQAEGVGHIKIGFTDGQDAGDRLASLQTGSPVPLRLLGTIPGSIEGEKDLHRRFAAARVCGEWFKPVPALLALINPSEPLTCGGVGVSERSVSIRVLTVGRRQFTKTLLFQLPVWWLDWGRVAAEYIRRTPAGIDPETFAQNGDIYNLELLTPAPVWGWVRAEAQDAFEGFRWVICEYAESLYRIPDPRVAKTDSLSRSVTDPNSRLAYCVASALHERRFELPGWDHDHQLFFGV